MAKKTQAVKTAPDAAMEEAIARLIDDTAVESIATAAATAFENINAAKAATKTATTSSAEAANRLANALSNATRPTTVEYLKRRFSGVSSKNLRGAVKGSHRLLTMPLTLLSSFESPVDVYAMAKTITDITALAAIGASKRTDESLMRALTAIAPKDGVIPSAMVKEACKVPTEKTVEELADSINKILSDIPLNIVSLVLEAVNRKHSESCRIETLSTQQKAAAAAEAEDIAAAVTRKRAAK